MPRPVAVVLPIYTATTFLRDPDNQYRRGRSYGRADNPSYDQLQAVLTALEGGAASLLFSSRMATAVLSSSASHETATSFGGVESLIEYRASIEGATALSPPISSVSQLESKTRGIWLPTWSGRSARKEL